MNAKNNNQFSYCPGKCSSTVNSTMVFVDEVNFQITDYISACTMNLITGNTYNQNNGYRFKKDIYTQIC
jgi:hypothetical protein